MSATATIILALGSLLVVAGLVDGVRTELRRIANVLEARRFDELDERAAADARAAKGIG